MASIELKLKPSDEPAAALRLLHARGSRPQTILSFQVGIEPTQAQSASAASTRLDFGVLTLERGVKYSTEKGLQHMGFLNGQGAFWGETLQPESAASFQVYVYLPEELFDRLCDWAKLGHLPETSIKLPSNQGIKAQSGGDNGTHITWDNPSATTINLETVRFDFPLAITPTGIA